MAEEVIGADSLRIIANDEALAGSASIVGPTENLRLHAWFGVSVYATQDGQLLVEYRMANGVWRRFKTVNIFAYAPYDQIWRKTREEYRVTYTDISDVASDVDMETMRTNVN